MREEFEKLRRAVVAGEVGVVFVHTASRLSRNQPELLAALDELDELGVAVHFVKNRPGIRSRAISCLRHMANALLEFALSLVGQTTRTP